LGILARRSTIEAKPVDINTLVRFLACAVYRGALNRGFRVQIQFLALLPPRY
jgi:hypothetical protein